ncbi:hypothetical protein [Nocardioides stalactiti]|uniref:hypothetical protein n=1 Tax=Nocardioides stalactiti TaxID=2755356 RepID=UPI001C80FB2C|nr:hypothetical protein [Nocardioides stalactiti]
MEPHLATAWGLLLPEETLHQTWFLVLAGFVAVNTVVYVTLAIAKALPRVYVADWFPKKYLRGETRGIYPGGPR